MNSLVKWCQHPQAPAGRLDEVRRMDASAHFKQGGSFDELESELLSIAMLNVTEYAMGFFFYAGRVPTWDFFLQAELNYIATVNFF